MMNCPYCEREMDEGSIQVMGLAKIDLGWYPKDANGLFSAEERLTTSKVLGGRKVVTYRCKACRKMVIDY